VALTILGLSFLAFLVLGVPVAFAIGLSALCTILYEGLPVAVLFQQMMSGMNVFSFLAIPFFVFSGELMLHGGIADKIVALARNLVGHIRGGLGMSNVVACTLFGGVSGSPVADVSAMGSVMIPMMKKEGYHTDYAVNVTTHAALVGALMPTSHNMIIYSLAAGGKVSIGALIAAGIVPALVLTVSMLVGRVLGGREARLSGGHVPGMERGRALGGGGGSGIARGRHHPRRHPFGRVHGDRIRGRRGGVLDRAHLRHLPDDDARQFPQGGGARREDDRRGAAPHRRVHDVPVPLRALRRGGARRRALSRCRAIRG
jgi:hypothetical protein